MPEPNQTKWVGVRPTDPPEAFGVTETTPLASIKVEPKLATTEFKTLTKKRSPAISDIQAIEDIVQFVDIHTQVGAGNWAISTGVVPGGKLWVITYCIAGNGDVSSNVFFSIFQVAVEKVRINQNAAAGAWVMVTAAGNLIVDEGQKITFQHNGIANGVLCLSSLCGYQIDKY